MTYADIVFKKEKGRGLKRITSSVFAVSLLFGLLTSASIIQSVKASGTIYIRADGSIDPPTAPISTVDYVVYSFTDNIYDEIVVERSNIIIDGAGYMLQGFGVGNGFSLTSMNNVSIRSTNINSFMYGISLRYSSNNTISGNNITANYADGIRLDSSSNNIITGNNITNNWNGGIGLFPHSTTYNIIVGNNITANYYYGIWTEYAVYNTIVGNNIANSYYGAWLFACLSGFNTFYHNNFVNNFIQAANPQSANIWDNGYPSGGNYWSDYTGIDANGDGIGDSPYVIDGANQDRYPLMIPYVNLYNVAITAHCNLEGADVNVSITMDGSPTGYITPQAFTGLTGIHTFTVPNVDPLGHSFSCWNTSETSTTIMVYSGGTYTAYYSISDIAVMEVVPSKTVVGQGYSFNVNVKVANQGEPTETFNVTAYANKTRIATRTVTLPSLSTADLIFSWNTAGFAFKSVYTISANATSVLGEADLVDNNCINGYVKVTIPGDINGDWIVNIKDATQIGLYWMKSVPPALANVDINCDGVINVKDASIVGINWQKDP